MFKGSRHTPQKFGALDWGSSSSCCPTFPRSSLATMAGAKSTLMSEAQLLAVEIKSTVAAIKKFKKIKKTDRGKHGGQGKFASML